MLNCLEPDTTQVISASILKNKKILFQSLFWKKFPSKNCEISFKFPLRNLIKLR